VVFGASMFTIYAPVLLAYAGLVLAPRSAGKLSYLATFPYLIWVHTAHDSGDAWRQVRRDCRRSVAPPR